MQLHDEILQEAVTGSKCTPEWAAMQTVKLYRQWSNKGLPHHDALEAAKSEMRVITTEALRLRRKRLKNDLAAWCVVILGVLACMGWWLLWE
ncbi:hypothetical protein FE783_12510 [Paenibacillus mesophilus]|uniref:hypothetical protein n=1 Tax=Paenibacillus mesophilus TaxID=2582849 RepID=UPI00110EBB1C|nr:hypothetical protein [Paenibacillus mesophilus]TMV49331.1 hypothetical protein FE783_12510 [Paenibacillus mesophilus]